MNDKNKIVDKIKIFGLCILSKVKIAGKLNLTKSAFKIKKTDKIVSGIDDLILQNLSKVDNSFAIHQSPDFQEWRIYSNPNYYKTHTFGVYKNKKLIALIVFNSHTNKIAYLCQSTFSSNLTNVKKAKILKSVTRTLFKEGIAAVRTWSFHTNSLNTEEITILNKAGYTQLNRGIGLV